MYYELRYTILDYADDNSIKTFFINDVDLESLYKRAKCILEAYESDEEKVVFIESKIKFFEYVNFDYNKLYGESDV